MDNLPDVRELVVGFCGQSPMQQYNQIAVVNRSFNITWRRQNLFYRNQLTNSAMTAARQVVNGGDVILNLLDLADISSVQLQARFT